MLLIKERMIDKSYAALVSRIGSLDFHSGVLYTQEGYKYNVFNEGHEIMTHVEDSYCAAGGKALGIVPAGLQGMQNLVDWRDASEYYEIVGKKQSLLESALRQLYTTEDDEATFKQLRAIVGNKYALISYFFFLKDKEKYAVMRPDNFAKRLPMVGASAKCTETCNWENYRLFLQILGEIKDYLADKIGEAGMSEAHSFLWALWQI